MTPRIRYYATSSRTRLTCARWTRWRMARQARGFLFASIMRLRRSVSPETWAEFVAWRTERDARWGAA